jgi:hypothetical protein
MPSGANVDVDMVRIHARTPGSSDAYFEFSKESRVTAKEQYERDRGALLRALYVPEISELEPVAFAGHEAKRFTATWQDRERVFTYIEHEQDVYRTVHDPRSAVNEQIVATLEILPP